MKPPNSLNYLWVPHAAWCLVKNLSSLERSDVQVRYLAFQTTELSLLQSGLEKSFFLEIAALKLITLRGFAPPTLTLTLRSV